MSKKFAPTPEQQYVIDFPKSPEPMQNMLVSASAGTGKTTTMISRIVRLIQKETSLDQIVVVTFTNLAAAEMKTRIAKQLADGAGDMRLREQLDKLDSASICTIHSFCSDILRNYFYVVDIDPAFSIVDTITASNLKTTAMEELFKEYFDNNDQAFRKLYQIYATKRREENFKTLIAKLHVFSRNVADFEGWYTQKRNDVASHDNNGFLMRILLEDINSSISHYKQQLENLVDRCKQENGDQLAQTCQQALDVLSSAQWSTVETAFDSIRRVTLPHLVARNTKIHQPMADTDIEMVIRDHYDNICKELSTKAKSYQSLLRANTVDQMWAEMDQSLELTDKLVEMVVKFDKKYFALKKQRGFVDFNDLEHLTLQVLCDPEALSAIKERYKYVFVDEYQDTNPVQEAIVSALVNKDHLFMVGDIKQSIYGFRGCEPGIFVHKYNCYKNNDGGVAQQLSYNFRSNKDILDFVNLVFGEIMTEDLGKVDYKTSAELKGFAPPTLTQVPSVRVTFLQKPDKTQVEVDDYYDITQPTEAQADAIQAKAIVNRIKSYIGMDYVDKKGEQRKVEYGDIVILLRSMRDRAMEIYNALVAENIPVTASFKLDGFATKEVRELVNLLRVIDNPYNDVCLVGVGISCFGGLTETDLTKIRLSTAYQISITDERGEPTDAGIPFYDRMLKYAQLFDDEISAKIAKLFDLVESLRFYSYGANVCEVVLDAIKRTNYDLFVQGLPNGALRLNKLNAFVDSLRGASYAESIDKFLYYIDETDENKTEQPLAQTNAVRLMTMHASKGLEFPIVILAGMETGFNFDNASDRNYVCRSHEVGISAQLYDFAQRKRCNTLGYFACDLYANHKQREEEMRLLYVAMTRPMYVLDIFATVTAKELSAMPILPRKAKRPLDWLLCALKNNTTSLLQSGKNLTVELVDQVQEQQTAEQNLLCEQQTDEQTILQKLTYRYPFESQTQMPTKIVSSALDKQFLDDEQSSNVPVIVQDDKNKIGSAYHAVYQFVDYDANVEQIESTIKALVVQGKIEEQYANELDANLIFATLQNSDFKAILSGGKVYHEIPFMLYAPYDQLAKDKRFSDKVMLQGVIDLLVIGQGKATVVDFKYTSQSDKVAHRYPYQLNSYKLAVQNICGIDNVDAYVLSIADNKLIKM